MLACCAFAIVLIAPFIAAWRRGRQALRRWLGLRPEPDNAAVSWALRAPGGAETAVPRRSARAVFAVAAAVLVVVAIAAIAHTFMHHSAHARAVVGASAGVFPDSICRTSE